MLKLEVPVIEMLKQKTEMTQLEGTFMIAACEFLQVLHPVQLLIAPESLYSDVFTHHTELWLFVVCKCLLRKDPMPLLLQLRLGPRKVSFFLFAFFSHEGCTPT